MNLICKTGFSEGVNISLRKKNLGANFQFVSSVDLTPMADLTGQLQPLSACKITVARITGTNNFISKLFCYTPSTLYMHGKTFSVTLLNALARLLLLNWNMKYLWIYASLWQYLIKGQEKTSLNIWIVVRTVVEIEHIKSYLVIITFCQKTM